MLLKESSLIALGYLYLHRVIVRLRFCKQNSNYLSEVKSHANVFEPIQISNSSYD